MNNEEKLESELSNITKKIEELPSGYISKKTINGKTKHYLQWTEDGKKKSKYIDDHNLLELETKIERRRELQKRLKELYLLLPKKKNGIKTEETTVFKTNVLVGETLKKYVSGVANYKRRGIYKNLSDYIYGETNGKVFILYGLRRTGKTTLIRQAIAEMDEAAFSKTAFVQIGNGVGLADVNHDLKLLLDKGFHYVFIDEATLMKDFIDGAALFSDVFATCGMKIVLSGTDSLGFLFSEDEQLYDRCVFLHTTFIPFKEFEEVLGVRGIDEYIRYGGTMSLGGVHYNEESLFANMKSVDEYIDSAIAKNIQHSLECYQCGNHFRALRELHEKDELTNAINRVVEDANHRFTVEVLTRDFISHDLGISARNLRNDKQKPTDILDRIDKVAFTKKLKELLEIKDKEERKVAISDEHRFEIKEYLDELDLTVDIDICSLPVGKERYSKTVFTQPGIRYSQAKELIKSLLFDETFQELSIGERDVIVKRILSDVKGRMMEDIVLLETKLAYPRKQVFQLQFAIGEFDMVVLDEENLTCEIYEIKHSDVQANEQYRHLIDEDKLKRTEFRYGKITKRVVIYRGKDAKLDNGIEYRNVEGYLKSLH